ncbi:MAG: nuclear transport factor 2 family protein [Chitinophagales bacterium]|nr:nuclear transport factor 2 family protein [Chitinophagales bacterium]
MNRIIAMTMLLLAAVNGGYAQNKSKEKMEAPKINFEKLKKGHWSEEERKNVDLIADFVQHIMNDHDFEYVLKTFDNNEYVQHNRAIPDGIKGLISYVTTFAKRFPEYSYDVKYIVASGDMVVFHSHVTTKAKNRGNEKKGFVITDTWKLRDGKIVEHWDAIQPLNGFFRFYIWLTGGKIRNSNGLF